MDEYKCADCAYFELTGYRDPEDESTLYGLCRKPTEEIDNFVISEDDYKSPSDESCSDFLGGNFFGLR